MALPQLTAWVNLGADPEIRRLDEGGIWVASFSAAANKTFVNGRGNEVKKTTWLRCVAWRRCAEAMRLAGLRKGAHIWIRGELEQERWDDNGEAKQGYQVVVFEFHLPPPRVPRGPGDSGGRVASEPDPGGAGAPG